MPSKWTQPIDGYIYHHTASSSCMCKTDAGYANSLHYHGHVHSAAAAAQHLSTAGRPWSARSQSNISLSPRVSTLFKKCFITADCVNALLIGIDKKWCSLKAWRWAASTVCSRTMHVPFCPAGALTPFGDLHNYHPAPPPHYPDIGQFPCCGPFPYMRPALSIRACKAAGPL